ncbi:hypothetical protein R6Z07F_014588 [Ovis aries]
MSLAREKTKKKATEAGVEGPVPFRTSFRGAWSPAGIDVKRRRSAAYRRLTRTLLHTPFLPSSPPPSSLRPGSGSL